VQIRKSETTATAGDARARGRRLADPVKGSRAFNSPVIICSSLKRVPPHGYLLLMDQLSMAGIQGSTSEGTREMVRMLVRRNIRDLGPLRNLSQLARKPIVADTLWIGASRELNDARARTKTNAWLS
jgi:hypothetical protein